MKATLMSTSRVPLNAPRMHGVIPWPSLCHLCLPWCNNVPPALSPLASLWFLAHPAPSCTPSLPPTVALHTHTFSGTTNRPSVPPKIIGAHGCRSYPVAPTVTVT
jgi:hypothetical protein